MDLRNHSQGQTAAPRAAESPASAKESASIVQIDPQASAALALAINSARQGAKKPIAADAGGPAVTGRDSFSDGRRSSSYAYASRAAMALVMIGSCWFGSYAGTLANRDTIQKIGIDAGQSQGALGKLSGEIEALKTALGDVREAAAAAAETQASDRAKLAEAIEPIVAALRSPDAKLSELEAKLDRMESQITSAIANLASRTAAPPAAEAAGREAAPAAAPAVRPARDEPISGWVVREVYDGAALVESQNRRLYEVAPGGFVPGVGRVEAIERRGRSWVVLTDKGVIGAYR